MRRLLCLLLAWICAATGSAAPLAPAARAEIDGLLARLTASACAFNRNGSWHTAAEAVPHLLRKLRYLEERGMVENAEQFIDRAASASSVSGTRYLVRCGNAATVESAVWLRAELRAIRASGRSTDTPAR
jgi:hypothetical protein